MGSLIEELHLREAEARAEANRLRVRIEELSEELARAEEQARLTTAREEVAGSWRSLPQRNLPPLLRRIRWPAG